MSLERVTVMHGRIVSGRGGGPEKTILNSPRFLAGTRWRELALYLHAPGDPGIDELRARAAELDCPFFAIPERLPIDVRVLHAIAELCARENVRIWHGHDYKSNLYGLLLRPLCNFRLVTTVHGWVQQTARTPLYWAVDRWTLRRYERVVAVSQDLHDACAKLGVAPERLSLIENGIDVDAWRRRGPPSASPLRAGVPPGRLVVGAVGRLSDEKGFDLLIEAVLAAHARGADLELWIAGEGPERAKLDALAARSAGRVRLLGFRSDVRDLMEAFDIFALSSLREGLPNVVLEAMACEVPLLATRCGGVEAVVRNDVEALLVPAGSSTALSAGLTLLASDPTRRVGHSHSALERVKRDFSFAGRMQRFATLYADLTDD
ncbi:MAG: glycosyltransferase family 4 protein [Planctomycetes bacterium]|nr:glycosyltransferase family 4 protein [Planctomycetota bacterium]